MRRRGTIRPSEYFRESWSIVPGEAADSALAELRSDRYARGAPPAEGEDAAPPLRLRVLHTNDFHGALLPQVHGWSGGREVGGAAALAGYFREERAGFAGPTLIVDGGDMYQGSPISNLTDGRSTIDYYNAAGYRGAALGNHEFDWGVDILANRSAQAAYPFLAANVSYEGSDSVPPWIRPAAVVEVVHGPDTVTVGLVGLASPETPDDTKKSNVAGLEFRDPVPAVDFWVPRLRAETDFVVVLAHLGAFCADEDGAPPCRGELVDLARSVRHPPDLIVGGHTHRPVAVVENGIALVEAATRGSRYGVVDLFRQPADSVASAWIRGLPVPWTDGVEPDSTVAALVERYRLEVGPRVNEVVATLDDALGRDGGEYALGRLIADAQRRAAEAQVAIMNNGGIRTGLRRGPVTWSDLYQVQPFENRIVRLVLTGEQLRQTLEHGLSGNEPSIQVSGLTVAYDPSRPPGARILEARLDGGRPLRSEATYTVAVNDFMAQGGSGFRVLPEALSVEETDIVDLSALVAYLRELPQPVRAPGEARLRPVRTAEGR